MDPRVEDLRAIVNRKVLGKISAEHDEDGHHYRFAESGQVVDSVTTKMILEKPMLRAWATRQALRWLGEEGRIFQVTESNMKEMFDRAMAEADNVKNDAAVVGTEAHEVIDRYLRAWILDKKRPDDIKKFIRRKRLEDPYTGRRFDGNDPRIICLARNAEKAIASRPIEPIVSEIIVGDETVGSAGQLDSLFFNTETVRLELLDWKSTNYVHDDYAMQLAVYKKFFENMTGIKVDDAFIVHLSKDSNKFSFYVPLDLESAYEAFKSVSKVYDWKKDGDKFNISTKKTLIVTFDDEEDS